MLDPIYYAVSGVMWFWHEVFGFLLGPASGLGWALSVVFLVLTLRTLMIKPFIAQIRSGRKMRAIAPQMAALRKRHAGDREALARETKALQAEHGVSTLAGCLPAVIQLPVFLGLLHVLRYFNRPGLTFEQNAAIPNYVFSPDEVHSFLEARLFGAPLSSYLSMPQQLLDSFGAHVERWEVAVVALPLMVIAAVATHITARHSLQQQTLQGPSASIAKLTPWIFPLFALGGGLFFPFPIAILLYWLTNNGWTLLQQRIVFRKIDAEMAAMPKVAVPVVVEEAPPPRTEPKRGASVSSKPRRNSSGHRPRARRR